MPQQIFNARNPTGTWVDDARDTNDRWNASRADQISQFDRSQSSNAADNAWKERIAMKELELRGQDIMGRREESAADRDARFKLAGLTHSQNLEMQRLDPRYQVAIDEIERNKKMRAGYAEMAKNPQALTNYDSFIQNLAGIDPQAAMPVIAQRLVRPIELQQRREDARNVASETAADRLAAGQYSGEKEKALLRQTATRGGMSDIVENRGQITPAATIKASAPEYSQSVAAFRESLKRLSGSSYDDQSAAAVGEIIKSQIEAAATEIAKQYGGIPEDIAKIMYADVVASVEGTSKGFWNTLGNVGMEIGSFGNADTERELALDILNQRFAQ